MRTGQSSFTTRWYGYCIRLRSRLSDAGIDFHRSTSKIMISPHDRRPGQRRQSHRADSPPPGWIDDDRDAIVGEGSDNPSAAQVGSRLV
jgi:hypothetical protein